MEDQKYAKLFKVILWGLMILSVGILLFGMIKGYPQPHEADNGTVAPLLYWAYVVIGLALLSVIGVGLYVRAKTDKKSLKGIGFVVVGAAVLFGLCYLLASGAPAVGYSGSHIPTASELKMTDTILNLAYIVGGAAILSIIAGEVLMTIRNKK